MLKAFAICVLIGWVLALVSISIEPGINDFYDVISALGMGLITALLGLVYMAANRKRDNYATGGYITTFVFGAIILVGTFYGAANP